jgi:arylsulfatase A-like enzyme
MSLFDPHDPYQDHPLSARNLIDETKIPAPVTAETDIDCVRREQEGSYLGSFSDFTADEVREIRFGYAASIAFADRQIERVLAALEAAGLTDDTLVIFMSDHGDQLGDHGLLVKGVALYEPTVGVPLILRWPGQVASGARCDALAQGRDVAATCLAAAGLDTTAIPLSEDLVEMARHGVAKRGAAICAYRNSGIDNTGRFWEPAMHATMARDERFKLTLYTSGGRSEREFFDLEQDPDEQNNLASAPALFDRQLSLALELAQFLQWEAELSLPRAAPSIPNAQQLQKNRLK